MDQQAWEKRIAHENGKKKSEEKIMAKTRAAHRRRMVLLAQAAYQDGVPLADIAKAVGVSRVQLAAWARENGTTISGRKSGE